MNELFYAAGDDSYLLIDAIEENKQLLLTNHVIIEVGCGSGVITKYLINTFGNAIVVSTDINQNALIETSRYNQTNLICSSLLNNVDQESVDTVVFNPPYVETNDDELCYKDIRASYSGGLLGRRVIDRFIEQLTDIDIVFLLVIRKNNVEEVISNFEKKGYVAKVVKTKRIMSETMSVIMAQNVKE